MLVSASLDHNLRAWRIPQSPEESTEPLKNLTIDKAHNSQINVVEQSHDGLELYSGSKDGIVNVWTLQSQTDHDEGDLQGLALVHTAQIQAQGSSVTAIAAIEPEATSHGKMMIYGGTDKALRIYRAREGDPHASSGAAEAGEEDIQH